MKVETIEDIKWLIDDLEKEYDSIQAKSNLSVNDKKVYGDGFLDCLNIMTDFLNDKINLQPEN